MGHAMPEPAALTDALRVETAGYRALITVLEAECDALRRADADALSTLTAAKLDHVSALHGLASARIALLERAGWPDMDAALATLAPAPDGELARREWAALLALAANARALNGVNGRLIATQQRHFDAALQSLLAAAGVSAVYSADGRPERGSTVRIRAAA
jgi:flagella synthesis protein FlgN